MQDRHMVLYVYIILARRGVVPFRGSSLCPASKRIGLRPKRRPQGLGIGPALCLQGLS